MKVTWAILSSVCVVFVVILTVLLSQNARLKRQIRHQKEAAPGQYLQTVGEFQIISAATKPDGTPVKIENSLINCVQGVVTNISGQRLRVAVVGFTLRDKAGNQVDYFETPIQNLAPHATWKFKTRPFDSRLNPVCTKIEGVIDMGD